MQILSIAFNKSIADKLNSDIALLRAGNLLLPPKTKYQEDICAAVRPLRSHTVVNALAGSGKTTTLMHVLSMFPTAQMNAATLHSTGFRALRYALERRGIKNVKVDEHKYDDLARSLAHFDQLGDDEQKRWLQIFNPALKLVDLFRCQGHTSFLPEASNDDCENICDRFSVELPEQIEPLTPIEPLDQIEPPDPNEPLDPERPILTTEIFDFARLLLNAGNKILNIIDFSDMIHLPLLLNASFLKYDLVLIDESQDLDPAQIEIARRLAYRGAKVCFVGDRHQAIYGFRGACAEAIESVVGIFNATELPLSICWRCPVNVVKEAQTIVPEIEWAPNAKEGEVINVKSWDEMYKIVNDGDFVLCRTTAPLVEMCFALIRQGKKATVRGRDIGQGLIRTCDKIAKSRVARGALLIEKILAWGEKELAKLNLPRKEAQKQAMEDRLETLLVLAEGCDDFGCMKDKINKIFSDQLSGIVCSTVHKAKGLESENVFIICPKKMPLPAKQAWQAEQEMNIRYVAVTRALNRLYWVAGDGPRAKEATARESMPTPESGNGIPDQVKATPKKTRKPRTKKNRGLN